MGSCRWIGGKSEGEVGREGGTGRGFCCDGVTPQLSFHPPHPAMDALSVLGREEAARALPLLRVHPHGPWHGAWIQAGWSRVVGTRSRE